MTEQVVTPFETKCEHDFDYDKLVNDFGVQLIDQELIERFEQLIGQPVHPWIRRGHIFAHRDLNIILDKYEEGKNIYIYTGRGPSTESMHLGHLVPFLLTKWLQDVLGCLVVIQIADDEKYFFKGGDRDDFYRMGIENAKDIIAIGFNPTNTYIFSAKDSMTNPTNNDVVYKIMNKININTIQKVFGLSASDSVGKHVWPILQTAPAYSQFFEFLEDSYCIVPYSIDQDPYFKISRDIAPKLKAHKPCSIIGKFLPAMTGGSKMSATGNHSIYLSDTPKQIEKKIKKKCFSGGRETIELQKELGANLKVDMAYQYLRFFEMDDDVLNQIKNDYGSGKMMTGSVKKHLVTKLTEIVSEHQKRRADINDTVLELFYNY